MRHLLLASQSPRRQQLLRDAGFRIDVIRVNVEETFPDNLAAGEIPVYLAQKKAAAYTEALNDDVLVTADTIVWMNGKVLNKPQSFEEAFAMIKSLEGKMHHVYTGVCMKSRWGTRTFCEATEVYFAEIPDEDIVYYINTFKPYDKAGAYGIQEWIGYRYVEMINGCYNNVVGFPVARFCKEIDKFTAGN